MLRLEDCLIRTDAQEAAFRKRYEENIRMYRDRYVDWFFRRFRLYEWQALPIHEGAEEFVIGLLCLLYREGAINLSFRFSPSGTVWIQREALTEEEHQEYMSNR